MDRHGQVNRVHQEFLVLRLYQGLHALLGLQVSRLDLVFRNLLCHQDILAVPSLQANLEDQSIPVHLWFLFDQAFLRKAESQYLKYLNAFSSNYLEIRADPCLQCVLFEKIA